MRKIAANLIFISPKIQLANSYLELDSQGVIQNICDTGGKIPEIENLEYYSGLLIPGLIELPELANAKVVLTHCSQNMHSPTPLVRKAWSIGFQAIAIDENVSETEKIKQLVTVRNAFLTAASGSDCFNIIKKNTIDAAHKPYGLTHTGIFDIGNCPGGLLINGFNFKLQRFGPNATIERLF